MDRHGLAWLLCLAYAVEVPEPLARFSEAGISWPALPCRMFAGVGPAKSDGKFIYTPSDADLVVWNDVSCSSSAAAAELRVTRAFQEQVDAMAFLPPKYIIIASRRTFYGFNYARLRFYNAASIGTSMEPMFMRRVEGKISSLLVVGDDLYFSAVRTKEGEHFIHYFPNVLTDQKATSMKRKTYYPMYKLLAFDIYLVASGYWELMIWRRDEMFKRMPILWQTPTVGQHKHSMAIQDMCWVEPQYLVVAVNPISGFGGGAMLRVFDLRKAIESGFEAALIMSQRMDTVFTSVAAIADLGFAVGTVNRTVKLYKMSQISKTQEPYKHLTVVKSFPTKLAFIHGAYLAVGTAENQVETFGLKRLLTGKTKGQPTMIIPVESRVIDFLELPGLGVAVAGLQHVHFFSGAATQFTSTRNAAFGSLSFCMDTAGITGRIVNFAALSGHRVMLGVQDTGLLVCQLKAPNQYRFSGLLTVLRHEVWSRLIAPTSSVEIAPDLLAVGMSNKLVLYNISRLQENEDNPYLTVLTTKLRVLAIDSEGKTLMAGTQNELNVWTTADYRTWKKRGRLKHPGNCWDLVAVGNGLWAAASDDEVVRLVTFAQGSLQIVKTLTVKGPAYALRPLQGNLLVATEFYLHVFEGTALDPQSPRNVSVAELPVNGVNSPPPANSISIVGNAILVGLELYRPSNPDAQCAPGTYSPPGAFECRVCPKGWTSFGAAGACEYPVGRTLLVMVRTLFVALLIFAWLVPQGVRLLLKLSSVSVQAGPRLSQTHVRKAMRTAMPYALVVAFPVYSALVSAPLLLAAPLGSTLLAAVPVAGAERSAARGALLCLAASSLVCAFSPSMWSSQVPTDDALRFCNLVTAGCNAYLALQIRRWLRNLFVNTQDGIRANSAGVRVVVMLAAVLYSAAGCLSFLSLTQHTGHAVWTPLGVVDSRAGALPSYLLALSTALSMIAIGFAANSCLHAEELHQAVVWARDEQVPPSKLPRGLRHSWLLHLSVWAKSWRFRHFLFMGSALYDSYTFYVGLRRSQKALSSQMYDFAGILFFALFTASINAMALLLDRFRVRMPELGDRNFRLSTLCKCILLFLKLRVLKVPLVVFQHMDSSLLSEQAMYIREKGQRIPIWMCSDQHLCPPMCKYQLEGNCTYTSQPAYMGCFCQYFTAGIPVPSDRFMVFGNCLISACVIALLTNSRMRTRGLFRFPELSLFALGCVTFLPTAFIAINTVYLSVPQLARMHVDSWQDFLVLTAPALIFVVMANEMARRIETAWKLRFLGEKEQVKLERWESQWEVVSTDGAPHLMGCRVEALDADGRSLLPKEGRSVTVQGPALLLFKSPQRYGSLWVSSGFRALTPLAHLSTLLAIYQVWERLFQGVIFVDVVILLLLSTASAILNFTLMDEEVPSISIRRSSTAISLQAQIFVNDAPSLSIISAESEVELQPT